jgi:hypothetical protein
MRHYGIRMPVEGGIHSIKSGPVRAFHSG